MKPPGRLSQIYVQAETRKLIWIVAKGRGLGETGDEVGDQMLLEAIKTKYPELVPHLNKIEQIEQDMILVIRK